MLQNKSWLGENKKTLIIVLALASIMALAFFIRVYWAIGPSLQYGYSVSGGSDSYYHERILHYILTSKHQLLNDPMLNYPLGVDNPRPPLFHWAIILASMIFYPFLNAYDSAVLMLILFPAIWGTLTIIPVYLLGKEAFNRKVGIAAAFFIAIMPAHIMRSVATQADWDAFDLFFITWMFYFFLMALKTTKSKNWIKDWFKKGEAREGLSVFFKENRKSIIYSALAGASLGALALAWKGYTYALAILAIYLVIQLIVNRIRNRSNLHILMYTTIYMIFGFLMAFPWYFGTHRIVSWYGVPLIMILIPWFIALYFELTSRYPWPFVFLTGGIIVTALAVVLNVFSPDIWGKIISGQGYFVHSKLYSTIAEAQPATMGVLSMSFGVGIFFLSIIGVFYILYLLRRRGREHYIFFVLYTSVAIFMAISAARFMFNAAPTVALTAAVALIWLIDLVDIKKSIKEFKKYRTSWKKAFKRNVKVSQVTVILVIAFLVVFPTAWNAIDAGIPYETKDKFDKQIYNALPSFMKPNETTYNKSSPWYLGAFGYSIPKPEYPWQRAWKWLSEQDNSTPPEDRPAFVSWWDYGFQAVEQGKHPTVADNFQDAYRFAAQVITAQNESEVISLFIARFLEADFQKNGGTLSQPVMNTLIKYAGQDKANKIIDILNDPDKYRRIIIDNPQIYGLYSNDIDSKNALYVAIKGTLAYLPQNKLISMYDSIRNSTGWDIRYFAVDYRLFPFSGMRTGIFYAPAELGDRRVYKYGGTVVPYDFYELKAVTASGNTYDLDKVPANARVVNYKIIYKPMFYHSMLYRTFIGYSGADIGKGDGIPGFSPTLGSYQPMQAWNMTHFKLVYKTAYWNPYTDYKNHTKAWKPIPIDLALKYEREHKGTVELNPPAYQVLPNDVVMVKFYEGAIIQGHIKLSTGEPMEHVRVTLFDEYGIPHDTTLTNDTGYFKLLSVAGNITLVVSTDGHYDKLRMVDKTILYHTVINITDEQAMRLKPNYVITKNITIKPATLDGVVYYDINHNKRFDEKDVKLTNAEFILQNLTYGYNVSVPIHDGQYEIKDIPPHSYIINLMINGKLFKKVETVTLNSGADMTKDIPLKPSFVRGLVTYTNGTPVENATVALHGIYTQYTAHTDKNGSFDILVVPDNYTITASKGDYYSQKFDAAVGRWNLTVVQNLTLTHGYELSGHVIYNGVPITYAVVKVKSVTAYEVYITHTDKNGDFKLNLPGGIYSIYILGNYKSYRVAYVGIISLNKDSHLIMKMNKAYVLYGKVTSKEKIVGDIEISAFKGRTFSMWFANQTGDFYIYLPEGTYSIGFLGFNNSYTPCFSRAIVHLNKNVKINPTLQLADTIKGYVYTGNNETLKNGVVMLKDSKGYYEVRSIPPNGEFTLGSTINYQLDAIVYGYHVVSIHLHKNKEYIKVAPNEITIKGKVYINNETNNMPITIKFISSERSYTLTDVLGSYSLNVLPGTYKIEITGNNIKYEYGNITIKAEVGEAIVTKNIVAKAFAHVNIVSQADSVYWFKDGRLVKVGSSVDVEPGIYTLYLRSYNAAKMVRVNIVQNTTLNINLANGYFVKLRQENFSYELPVIISSSAGNITWKFTNIVLPSGHYIFTIEVKKMVWGKYYLYWSQVDEYIGANTIVVLHVITKQILAKVSGVVTIGDRGVADTIIKFIPSNTELQNVTVTTDSAGYYMAKLTPGKYMVYSYYIMGEYKYAYIGSIEVNNSAKLNIEYEKGYILYGEVYLNGSKISTIVNIETPYGTLSQMANGYYYAILPHYNYTITAKAYRTEYGQKVDYKFEESVNLTKDTALDVKLQRQSVHMISVDVLGYDKNAMPYKTIWMLIKLKNTGNSPENVKFEVFSHWRIVNPNSYHMMPGDMKIVSLGLKVPMLKAGDNQLHLRVKYTQFTDKYIHINVENYYNTTANYSLVSWNQDALIYRINVYNHGNTWVNYTFYVLNSKELFTRGWNVEIYGKLGETNHLNVSANSHGSLEIRIIATKYRPGTSLPVEMAVKGMGKTILLQLPLKETYVQPAGVYINGPKVTNYTSFEIPNSWYALWGVTIAALAVFIIFWRWKR